MASPLTTKQLSHFQMFGFLILKDYLSPDESAQLAAEHEAALDAYAADKSTPFNGMERHSVRTLSDRTPLHAALPEDARFQLAAAQLYGTDVFFAGCDANRYVGASDWVRATTTASTPLDAFVFLRLSDTVDQTALRPCD